MRTILDTLMSPLRVRTKAHSKVRPLSNAVGDDWLPTGYLDGIFKLELFLPEEYPMAPPKVRFLTKIYHPNIGIRTYEYTLTLWLIYHSTDKLGRICLDILKGE